MRRVVPSFLLLLLTSTPALAVFGARDEVPAATLLVPYVVVQMQGDVPDRTGATTFSTSPTPAPRRHLSSSWSGTPWASRP